METVVAPMAQPKQVNFVTQPMKRPLVEIVTTYHDEQLRNIPQDTITSGNAAIAMIETLLT